MSYIDSKRRSPSFGGTTINRAASALADVAGRLGTGQSRRGPALSRLTPAQLEDIGVTLGDLDAGSGPGLLGRSLAAFREWRLRQRTASELSRLGDAQLHDIGLTRGDVEHLRYGGRFD